VSSFTITALAARLAACGVSAHTAPNGCPAKRMAVSKSCPLSYLMSSTSSRRSTSRTPGISSAGEKSIERTRPFATGDRTIAVCSMPALRTSAV
jgi:hypothetical protein